MRSNTLALHSVLLSTLAALPNHYASAAAVNQQATVQSADFWLWFSEYSDASGQVFDPADLESIMQRENQNTANQTSESTTRVDTTDQIESGDDDSQALDLQLPEEGK